MKKYLIIVILIISSMATETALTATLSVNTGLFSGYQAALAIAASEPTAPSFFNRQTFLSHLLRTFRLTDDAVDDSDFIGLRKIQAGIYTPVSAFSKPAFNLFLAAGKTEASILSITQKPPSFKTGIEGIPVPAAIWLFGSAVCSLIGLASRKRNLDLLHK